MCFRIDIIIYDNNWAQLFENLVFRPSKAFVITLGTNSQAEHEDNKRHYTI